MLSVLSIGSAVPFLELAAYAGYAFVPACASLLAATTLGERLLLAAVNGFVTLAATAMGC